MIPHVDNLPKISCLMVTRQGRLEQVCRSYVSFSRQSYPNRELIVVNEGPESYQHELKSLMGHDPKVRFLFLSGFYTLGALRNISVLCSDGELWVQWDDDDFCCSSRLLLQYRDLISKQAKVSFLSDQLHYFFPTKELFWESWLDFSSGGVKTFSAIPGTIMAVRTACQPRYPSSGPFAKAGEDSVFVYGLMNEVPETTLLSGRGNIHVYSYHGENVWDLQHHLRLVKHRAYPCSFLLAHRQDIIDSVHELHLPGPVKVIGRDGLAFICEDI